MAKILESVDIPGIGRIIRMLVTEETVVFGMFKRACHYIVYKPAGSSYWRYESNGGLADHVALNGLYESELVRRSVQFLQKEPRIECGVTGSPSPEEATVSDRRSV